jgi:hypothetical protein
MSAVGFLFVLAALVAGGSANSSTGGDTDRYAFCYAWIGDVTYHSGVYRGAGGDAEHASFVQALSRSQDGQAAGGVCSARSTAPEALATRDSDYREDLPEARMTTALPVGKVAADVPGASMPDIALPADGSVERPLILDCTPVTGRFVSLTRLYPEPNGVKIRIAGDAVSFWRPAERVWVQHPCVEETRNGQFCAIAPDRFEIKDAYDLRGGMQEVHDLVLSRTGPSRYAFEFTNVLIDTGTRTFVSTSMARGDCRPGQDPGT